MWHGYLGFPFYSTYSQAAPPKRVSPNDASGLSRYDKILATQPNITGNPVLFMLVRSKKTGDRESLRLNSMWVLLERYSSSVMRLTTFPNSINCRSPRKANAVNKDSNIWDPKHHQWKTLMRCSFTACGWEH